MPAAENAPDDRTPPGPRPMSRRASRLFVIAAIVLVFALSFAAVYYLVQVAESNPEPPVGAPADTALVDTTAGA